MQINWWTFALQVVNFLVLVWLLWHFLYRPVRDVIEKRKARAEEAFAEAGRQKEEAEAARRRLEQDRASLADERQDLLKKVHEELEVERGKTLAEAKQQAEKLLAAACQEIADERAGALAEMREQAASLAVDLAAGLLREVGANGASATFLERLERQLKELPVDERERLERDLAADGARLTVVTAAPLASEEQERWKERLNACLGQEPKIEFAIEPEILGGAELRFPHSVIKLTWQNQLRKALEVLRTDEAAS